MKVSSKSLFQITIALYSLSSVDIVYALDSPFDKETVNDAIDRPLSSNFTMAWIYLTRMCTICSMKLLTRAMICLYRFVNRVKRAQELSGRFYIEWELLQCHFEGEERDCAEIFIPVITDDGRSHSFPFMISYLLHRFWSFQTLHWNFEVLPWLLERYAMKEYIHLL